VIHSAGSEQGDSKKDTTSKAIHSIFKNAIQLLQEKGFVFQKDDGFDKLYYVTREDKELHRKIHHIIQEDCQKPNRKWRNVHVCGVLVHWRGMFPPREHWMESQETWGFPQ